MKITQEYTTAYNNGDVVVFKKDGILQVGIIEGGYIDCDCWWFNIRVSPEMVYTYSNHGDISESDIYYNITEPNVIAQLTDLITKDDWY